MAILGRASRALAAQFDGLLRRLESPEHTVDAIVGQLEEQLRQARRQLVADVAAEKQLRRRAEQLQADVSRWLRRAELAVERREDGLARAALQAKARAQTDRERTEQLADQQRQEALEMKAELGRMEQRLAELRLRKGTIAVQLAHADGQGPLSPSAPGDPFSRFSAIEERIESVEAVFEAQREVEASLSPQGSLGLSDAELEAKFQALEQPRAAAMSGVANSRETEAQSHALDLELSELKKRYRV